MRIAVGFAAAFAMALPSQPLAAQEPVVPTPLAMGETAHGRLGIGDPTFQDGSYYKPFEFFGSAGDQFTLWLSSADFNTNLIVVDSTDHVVAGDDDGDGNCNAWVQLVLPFDGNFIVFVNGVEPREGGQFQLSLQPGLLAANGSGACHGFTGYAGAVAVGDSVSSTLGQAGDRKLSGTSFYHVWLVDNRDGESFTADLLGEGFDGVLMLVRGLRDVVAQNDDGAGGCNARLAYAPSDASTYRLVAVSRTPNRGGPYRLRLTEGLLPTLTEPACTPNGDR